eukprot:1158768-Pelagomonas_calceolata.AAC.3
MDVIDLTLDGSDSANEGQECPSLAPASVLANCKVSVTGFGHEGRRAIAEQCRLLGAAYRPGAHACVCVCVLGGWDGGV